MAGFVAAKLLCIAYKSLSTLLFLAWCVCSPTFVALGSQALLEIGRALGTIELARDGFSY